MNKNIKNLFYPRTICIAGASSKKGSIGYELTSTILSYGYKGEIILINPKADEILGIKCLPSVQNINKPVDMAIILVPKNFAEQTIKDLIEKNVKSFVLITAGFKETGSEGEAAEKRILELVRNAGANMTGPNCMGVINTLDTVKLNATFVAEKPETGTIAFLSQSGALGAAVLNSLRETDIRFAHFVSVGNKADLNENHFIDFWEEDENIKVVTFYLESFSAGEELIQKFVNQKVSKPLIVLKAGRTGSGMKAASSHTGAMGSSDKVVDAVIEQFGMIRADNLNELFNTAKGFENFPLPAGNRIAVVTNAGGPAILAVDALERNGLLLSELTADTKQQLREFVHPEGSISNPVDLLPGGDAAAYKKSVELLASDPNVDAVVSIFVEPVMVKPLPVIEGINSVLSPKPIIQVAMPLPEFWNYYKQNSNYNRPLFKNPEDPAEIISNMLRFKQFDFKTSRLTAGSKKNNKYGSGFLSKEEIDLLGKEYNIPLLRGSIVNYKDLKNYKTEYPVVIKSHSAEVIHKSELNGVVINLKNKDELLAAAEKMRRNFSDAGYELNNFNIQPYIETRYELLVGGFRDSNFGPMIMFGTGGKYVEYYKDTKMYSAYLSDKDIENLICSTTIGKLLSGVRGKALQM